MIGESAEGQRDGIRNVTKETTHYLQATVLSQQHPVEAPKPLIPYGPSGSSVGGSAGGGR